MNDSQKAKHQGNQRRITEATLKLIRLLPEGTDAFSLLAKKLPEILKEANFDASPYTPRNQNKGGYSKTLLLQASLPNGQKVCLQVFAFGEGQTTPVHDHPVHCASTLVEGNRLAETRFTHEKGRIVPSILLRRRPGDIGLLTPGEKGRDTHCLHNIGSRAVTVHLYKMDGLLQSAAVKNVYRDPRSRPL